jgi:hypothetical protein
MRKNAEAGQSGGESAGEFRIGMSGTAFFQGKAASALDNAC